MTRRTYRHVLTALAGGALLLGACETETKLVPPPDASTEDTSTTPDSTVEEDTKTPDVFPTLKESARFKWSIPDALPDRNPGCLPAGGSTNGTVIPWTGFIHDGTTYTCNACPNGDPEIQGTWRFVHDPDDPTKIGEDGALETVKFDGNTFTIRSYAKDDKGKMATSVKRGWYFCGLKPEFPNEMKGFVTTDVQTDGFCEGPVGACWEPGLIFTGYTLGNGGGGLLWDWFYDFVTDSTSTDADQPYCRIGTFVGEHPCEDPFAE